MKANSDKTSASGLEARKAAVAALQNVLREGAFLDDAFSGLEQSGLDLRDLNFAKAIAAETLRRRGQLEAVLSGFMDKPLKPSTGLAHLTLLTGAAQILFMEVEPHAAINTSVNLVRADKAAGRFKPVINAVLRRIAEAREVILADLPEAGLNTPKWLRTKFRADLGPDRAEEMAQAHLTPPDLDISLKHESYAQELETAGAKPLPTGSMRFVRPYPAISGLPGFDAGNWWVQDAAAALPAKLLDVSRTDTVLDMCAAPGGKTLQLASLGAKVTALDVSEARMEKVRENLARTKLDAQLVVADAAQFSGETPFDAVLLDAPCSATGTIRRHPELPWIRRPDDLKPLLKLQRTLLRRAAELVRPGGTLVYAVCSVLAEEGPKQVQGFLNENREFKRLAVEPATLGLTEEFLTKQGDLRTLPGMALGGMASMDGFYAARLVKFAD